jgi:microsomal epoxide hydrolase
MSIDKYQRDHLPDKIVFAGPSSFDCIAHRIFLLASKMASISFDTLPAGAADSFKPWKVEIPQQDLEKMFTLLKAAPIATACYENASPSSEQRNLGIQQDWVTKAVDYWINEFDWRKQERYINTFPHFKALVDDKLGKFEVHFVSLFSKKTDATPVLLLHGWPGSILEFLPLFDIIRSRYTPETLPYHLIAPSLPGYTFSPMPSNHKDFGLYDAARIFDRLASMLGFDSYVVQGGDVGGRVARLLAAKYDNCKAIHLNTCPMQPPKPDELRSKVDEVEQVGLERAKTFTQNGIGYAIEQATRPATIGMVLQSSPLAVLCWIGEKFIDWTDETPSLDVILESVSLYWLTGCIPTCFWSYRQFYGPDSWHHGTKEWYIHKPFGFSFFPKEISPVPRAWAETTGDLVFYRQKTKGGHFAALEQPHELWADFEEFLELVQKGGNSKL